ncbi:MAG: tetratricopeptide repeat protein [Chthoniobacterales bacterium]
MSHIRTSFSLVLAFGILTVFFSCSLHAENAVTELSKSADALFNQGRYAEAAQGYESIVKDYPTSELVFGMQLQLGYCYYFLAEYDKAQDYLQKFLLSPGATPQLKPIAMSLLPQVISQKATALPASDPKRKTLYEEAIKKFTEFTAQFPNAPDIETAVYGRAIANFQIGNYDEAAKDLEANIQKFPNSPSILDSHNLLALTYATLGNKLLISGEDNAKAVGYYDKAIQLLHGIIEKKSDLTLVNSANFQLGEILFSRTGFASDTEKPALFNEARSVYDAVASKNDLVAQQQTRVASIPGLIAQAVQKNDTATVQSLNRERIRQNEKLMQLKGSPDQVLSALLKIGEIYFNEGHYDEARVIFNHLQPLLQTDADKKQALYFIALSYVSQNNTDKAIEIYNQFQSQYKGDPIASNLPLVVGNMLLNGNTEKSIQDAVQYFQESLQIYPKGPVATLSAISLATAQSRLKKTDEALKSYQDLLQTKLTPSEAVLAQLGLANIYKDTLQWDNALTNYKIVLEKYPDAKPQVTEAEFWIALTTQNKGDQAAAIPLLKAFIEKYPDTPYIPNALYALGAAQFKTGDKDGAIASFKQLADKYPKSQPAPYTYFQRAQIVGAQKPEEVKALMQEFIQKYPDDDKVFPAYDSLGLAAQAEAQKDPSKPELNDEVIRIYTEYADKYTSNPQAVKALLKVATTQRNKASALGRYGALQVDEREKWNAALNASVVTSERIVKSYPDSPDLALALQGLLQTQVLLMTGEKKPEEVEDYFKKIGDSTLSPAAKSKILFTLASFISERDKARALQTMQTAYDPEILYAPADMDNFGLALIENNKLDDAQKVFVKLAANYPIPSPRPAQLLPQVAEAQADALFGQGRIAQIKGQTDEAGKFFQQLKTEYGWSPKVLEATYGIAESKRKTAPDEALKLLAPIIPAPNATVDLRANSMLLFGYIYKDKMEAATDAEAKNKIRQIAIDNFLKIQDMYEKSSVAASTGLWEGSQLLEQQAATLTDPKVKDFQTRQLNQAKANYQSLIAKYPNSPYVEKAKERLAAMGGGK